MICSRGVATCHSPSKSSASAVKEVSVLWVSSCIAEGEAPDGCSGEYGCKLFHLCWLWCITAMEAFHPVKIDG